MMAQTVTVYSPLDQAMADDAVPPHSRSHCLSSPRYPRPIRHNATTRTEPGFRTNPIRHKMAIYPPHGRFYPPHTSSTTRPADPDSASRRPAKLCSPAPLGLRVPKGGRRPLALASAGPFRCSTFVPKPRARRPSPSRSPPDAQDARTQQKAGTHPEEASGASTVPGEGCGPKRGGTAPATGSACAWVAMLDPCVPGVRSRSWGAAPSPVPGSTVPGVPNSPFGLADAAAPPGPPALGAHDCPDDWWFAPAEAASPPRFGCAVEVSTIELVLEPLVWKRVFDDPSGHAHIHAHPKDGCPLPKRRLDARLTLARSWRLPMPGRSAVGPSFRKSDWTSRLVCAVTHDEVGKRGRRDVADNSKGKGCGGSHPAGPSPSRYAPCVRYGPGPLLSGRSSVEKGMVSDRESVSHWALPPVPRRPTMAACASLGAAGQRRGSQRSRLGLGEAARSDGAAMVSPDD